MSGDVDGVMVVEVVMVGVVVVEVEVVWCWHHNYVVMTPKLQQVKIFKSYRE